ncbi:hypothetical protein COM25_22845 [Bacillus wiedmannii]|nr:hypothetical protein COM25_22845 [Bacillus wiedmannii]
MVIKELGPNLTPEWRNDLNNNFRELSGMQGAVSDAATKAETAQQKADEALKPATKDRIADGAIINSKLGEGSVSNSKLSDRAVSNAKLTDGAVSNNKLGPGAVENDKIADKAVDYKKIAEASRGLGINVGNPYPLKATVINGNNKPGQKPLDAHYNTILSVKIHGALKHKVYAIENIYNGYDISGTLRYGVTFGAFDRKADGTVDASSFKRILSLDDMEDQLIPVTAGEITKLYKVPNYNLMIEITYNTVYMTGTRLAYISGNDFFECAIHPSSSFFRDVPIYKKINFLGDSLTALNGFATKRYHDWIRDWLGVEVKNYGISGSTVGNKYNPMSERFIDMDNDADVVITFGNTNDFGRDQPLGTMADRTNETFYGAMHVLLKGLLDKYPDKKIGYISMHHFGTGFFPEKNTLGLTKLDYVKATREVCEYYSIPLLDLYRGGGFNFEIEGQKTLYSVDSLHFNNKGHERLAKLVYEFILRL